MMGTAVKVGLGVVVAGAGVVGWSHSFARKNGGRMPPALHDAILKLGPSLSAPLLALAPTLRAEFALAGAWRAAGLADNWRGSAAVQP